MGKTIIEVIIVSKKGSGLNQKTFLTMILLGVVVIATITVIALKIGKNSGDKNQYLDLDSPSRELAFEGTDTESIADTNIANSYAIGEEALVENQIESSEQLASAKTTASAQTETAASKETQETMQADGTVPDKIDVGNMEQALNDAEESAAPVVSDNVAALNFTEQSTMIWPIQGDVILDYSMDTTTYFSTLKQYKVNPAILIQGQDGMSVAAPANGQITEIGSNEEIGNYIVMNLGNGYTAKIGELRDITKAVNDVVNEGDVLGVLSVPTKYYTVEGCNLYFELQKDGTPIDPLDYIR